LFPQIIEYLKDETNFELSFLFLTCGLYVLYFDRKDLLVKRLFRESKMVIGIGIAYIIISISLAACSVITN
jgi:hypothetical protein